MKLTLSQVCAARENWSLSAHGSFGDGIHLVSGDIGSGKSTLALVLAGLLPPASGTIEKERIGTMMLAFQFPEYHITAPNLELECRSWGLDPVSTLAAAGLAGRETCDPLSLSRGELKRLILSCILAKEYDLLILDEPFSSLDCAEKERLCATLSLRRVGITIIFTHEHCHFPRVDRIWEIQDGALYDRGELPAALARWELAPSLIKQLIARKKTPSNISPEDLREAACRT